MADEAVELADEADLDETEAWEAWGSSTPGGPSRVGSSLALAAQEAAAALARQGAREEAAPLYLPTSPLHLHYISTISPP